VARLNSFLKDAVRLDRIVETVPRRLKPRSFRVICGTTEVVPFQNSAI